MKKICLLAILILAPVLWAQAQYLRVGAKVGGGLTTAQGDNAPSDYINNLAGLHGGLILGYEFVSRLAVQGELLYVQQGFVYDDYPVSATEVLSGEHRLHYITLPLKLKIQKGGLFAEGGPYAGYLIAENVDVDRLAVGTSSAPEPVVLGEHSVSMDDLERWDYGYTVGLGIQLSSGPFMSFHYTRGLTSFSEELDQVNSGFRISIGYLLSPPTADEMMYR